MLSLNKTLKKQSDTDLIVRYRETGEPSVLGELFCRYTHLVYAISLKYLKNEEDGRDAVMEVFQDLSITLRKHDITNFKSWLYSVARNHCLTVIRKRKNGHAGATVSEDIYELAEKMVVENPDPGHPTYEDEKETALQELEAAVEELNEEQRMCIKLFYLDEKSYKEISDQTGFDLKKVKSHIQNGKRNLKIRLSGKDHDHEE